MQTGRIQKHKKTNTKHELANKARTNRAFIKHSKDKEADNKNKEQSKRESIKANATTT